MEENNNIKKGRNYLVIGIVVLFLSILGASVSYYLARVQGTLTGRAAGTELELTITKLSTSASMDLIPLDNDLETLNLASLGYGNNSEEFDATKACIDINGYSVCQIYKVRVSNNGSVPVVVNGTVTLSGQNVPNIDCVKMDDEVTVTSNASCKGSNILASSVTLAANSYNDYYIMVYINNLDEPQYDSGTFNGTVIFTSEDGKKVKGRFTKPFNLAQHITNLYTNATKTEVTNNEIDYNYATSENLMNDRQGGTTQSLDGGNIRYYGASPSNWIDIGDKYETTVSYVNGVSFFESVGMTSPFDDTEGCIDWVTSNGGWSNEVAAETGYSTLSEFCSTTTIPAGTPILWRIIGVFDGKVRIVRNENIGIYSYDTSALNVNDDKGINEWSQADLMKLLNPEYSNNSDIICTDTNSSGISHNNTNVNSRLLSAELIREARPSCEDDPGLVNNSLWWNSESGTCYVGEENRTTECDFESTGLSDEAKEYVIDQTLYLGGFNWHQVYANQAYTIERGNNVFDNTKSCYGQTNCNDGITRTLSWIGKVGLPYPSDFGYAIDFSDSNCQEDLGSLSGKLYNCTANWMNGSYWTISPWANSASEGFRIYSINMFYYGYVFANFGVRPTLLLDSSALAESGNGSYATPYVVAY